MYCAKSCMLKYLFFVLVRTVSDDVSLSSAFLLCDFFNLEPNETRLDLRRLPSDTEGRLELLEDSCVALEAEPSPEDAA